MLTLAQAIIKEAADDYRQALRLSQRYPKSKYHQEQIKELEDWFYSSQFEKLTDLNPEYLVKKLKEEAKCM